MPQLSPLFALALFCVGEPALAAAQRSEDASEPDPDLVTGDVVVIGTRTEVPLADSPARVEVVSREEVESSGARDATELIEERPGIVVTRTFRGDAIQMDGLDPEYTLVLVDGDRVPGRIGGAVDLGRYGVESIERIEILRGSGSALYGSDAIAGVVNIVTRRPREPLELSGGATYGWFGGHAVDATALAGARLSPFTIRLSGGYHFADPFDRDGADLATTGSARDQWSIGGRADVELMPGMLLEGRVEYLSRVLRGVDTNAAGAIFDRTQQAEQLVASVAERLRAGSHTDVTARFTYSLFREQYLYDQRGGQALDDYQDNREHLGQITLQLDHSIGDHRLSFGYEQLIQELESDRLVSVGRRTRLSPFAQEDWTILDDDVLLVAVVGARLDIDSQFGDQLSPRIGLRFDPVPQLTLRASFGMGFRAPSFQELLLRFENPGVGYVVAGNPSLSAERSYGTRVDADWQPLAELGLGASFYRNDLTDMITTVTESEDGAAGTLFSYANIAAAYTQGLETRATLTPITGLRAQLGYVLTDTRDEALGRPLEGRALHRWTLSVRLAHRETGLSGTLRTAVTGDRVYFEDRDGDGAEDPLVMGPMVQTDLRVGLTLLDHLELYAGVDNLIDAGDAFFALRPRTLYAGARGHL